ncbi:MAG: tetratricopeptide repeat protein, partial [Acidobacteriota bacterium]
LRRRIELFVEVCRAVHFAHQSLVVHRDLKPANLLVSQRGEPKLLDFGVAKLLGSKNPDLTQMVGSDSGSPLTPDFAAPEQVTGAAITTGTDVYALGGILYVLLTGARPLRSRGLSLAQLVDAIRHRPTERPSERVRERPEDTPEESTARRRAAEVRGCSEPAQLRRLLAGDLDAIVTKAMNKDPAQRYPSAEGLAQDLDNYLVGRPVQASESTVLYRAGKFLRRHRVPVLVAALVLAVLASLGLGLLRQRDRLLEERAVSQEVTGFLEGLFEVSMPERHRGREVPARDLLDRGAIDVRSRFADQPQVRSRLTSVMGRAYLRLGHLDEAETLLLESAAGAVPAGSDPESHFTLAELRIAQGRYPEAMTLLKDAAEGALGPVEELRRRLAVSRVLHFQGDLEGALGVQTEVLEALRAHHPEAREFRAKVLRRLGGTARSLGDFGSARSVYLEARGLYEDAFGEMHPEVARLDLQVGLLFEEEGRFAEAEAEFRRALEAQTRLYPEGHSAVAETLRCIASVLYTQGRLEDAEAYGRRSLEMARRFLGGEHPGVGTTHNLLGLVLLKQKRLDEAEASFREALKLHRDGFGGQHPQVAGDLSNLAQVQTERGDLVAAEAQMREALAIYRNALGDRHIQVATVLNNLAVVRKGAGDFDGARELYGEALEVLKANFGELHPRTASAHHNLAMLLLQQGRPQEAEPFFRRALAAFEELLAPDHSNATLVRRSLAKSLLDQGRGAEAEALIRETLEIHLAADTPEHDPRLLTARGALAEALAQQGRRGEGVAMLERDLALAREHHGADSNIARWLLKRRQEL